VSFDVDTAVPEDAPIDPSSGLPHETVFDIEKDKFFYDEDGYEENADPPVLSATKPAPFPPMRLACDNIPDLVAKMNALDISLHMPSVTKDQLSHPEGPNIRRLMAIKSLRAQGKEFHDESCFPNYNPLDGKRVATIVDWNFQLKESFEIVRDDEKGVLFKVQCKSCENNLDNLLTIHPTKCGVVMKDHYFADCKKKCPCCGITASNFDNAHQQWRYNEFYIKRLCKGEKRLPFEAFVAAAKQFKTLPNHRTFFPDGNALLRFHTQKSSTLDKSDCAIWHQHATMYKEYIETYETDVITQKNWNELEWPAKEKRRLENWRRYNFLPNEYGSYGESRNLAFTGNRHVIVHELHELIRQKKTKGTRKLSSFFGKK